MYDRNAPTRMPKRVYVPPRQNFHRLHLHDAVADVLKSPEAVAFCDAVRAMQPPPPTAEEVAAQAAAAAAACWPLRPLPPAPRPRPPAA